ncbi:MAG: PUA domain-containing protein [Candidatus Nitrosocaldaceae archaeon]
MVNRLLIDPKRKFCMTLDSIFCSDISSSIPLDRLNFTFSKRTGKIKHVMMDDKIIATLRTDGGFAITLDGARFLLESNKVKENCIIIKKEVVDFIKSGRSVFCKHVISCGRNIEVESDAIILDDNDRLVAVGKAILPYSMIIVFKRGAAVRVRHSIND